MSNEINDLRRKLAMAGVEGSPPPGEQGTIQMLVDRVAKLEARIELLREVVAKAAVPLEALNMSVQWELSPAIKKSIYETCNEIRTVLIHESCFNK